MMALINNKNPRKAACHLPTLGSEIELAQFALMLHQVRPSHTLSLGSHGHQLLYSLPPANEQPAHVGGRPSLIAFIFAAVPFRSPRSSRTPLRRI
jgi:hypothetical protein